MQSSVHFMCDLMSDLVICKFRKLFSHDTKCPYWDQVLLNNTNQIKPNQTSTYPHKALRKIKVTRFNNQGDGPLYVYVWDVYSAALPV